MAVFIILISCVMVASGQFEDEMQTYEPECLEEGAFSCLAGGCVSQDKYCDGSYDCPDGSDENFCFDHTPDALVCNETHQYMCVDKKRCIPNIWVCNNETDCEDGSDEASCTTFDIAANATCKGFLCDGNKCISSLWMCDGSYDCVDRSDEDVDKTCRHALRPHVASIGVNCRSKMGGRMYKCLDNSFCLNQEQMCDGMRDCRDNSDEGSFCNKWKTMCTNFTCKGNTMCIPERNGPNCICLVSDVLQQYNYTSHQCEDVNDCQHERPQCSHMCSNENGYFLCSCEEGYMKDSFHYLCYAPDPEGMLFFSTKNDIRYVKIKSKQQFVVATGIKQAHGVSYDGTYLYWVETAQAHQSIVRAKIEDAYETNKKQVLVSLGLEDPGDIAIDWLGGNIFFSDAERGTISVCRTDGSYCATSAAVTKHPRFVTLDVKNGNMYWADWRNKPVLMQARLDGSRSTALLEELYTFATGLAMDSPNGRLYFVDRTIKVVKLDDRKVYSLFEERFHHPYSIAVFENTVFWSDWTSNTIQTTDKIHSTAEKRNVLLTLDVPVFDMHIYHPLLMRSNSNPCEKAGCSHFCFVTSKTTFSCGCPDGMELKGNICQHQLDYRPQYLVIGGGSSFSRWQYNALGNPEAHATTFNIGKVQAMAYDNLRDKLYIFDGYRQCVQYIDMRDFSTGVTHLFLQDGRRNVVDMDYDYVSDALYILDAGRHLIEAVSLKTKDKALIYVFGDEEIPISFTIASEYGRMLVALEERELNNEIHIDSIGLDGGNRRHLLMTNLRGPHVRLRYSQWMDVVYISDEGQGIIDYVHPEGTGRENFRELSTTIADMAVTDTHVFWTDKRTARIFWADLHELNHKIRRIELSIFPNNTHLHILATTPPPEPKNPLLKHRCFTLPSPCPELCVQVAHDHPHQGTLDMGYKCLCSPGRTLVDGRCTLLTNCKEDELFCHRSNRCFASDKKCDGHKDCLYGEDEEGCPKPNFTKLPTCGIGQISCHGTCIDSSQYCSSTAPSTEMSVSCSSTEFRCNSDSLCISRSLACDGRSDCPDGSDELPAACDTKTCLHTEFMCASGTYTCIPISWRCDSSDDCIDGSDELDCVNKTCGFGYYKCQSGECVELMKRCDHKFDCTDHTDEEDCEDREEPQEPTASCPPWEYACERNTSICLPPTARCNGKTDCPGGTDEHGCDYRCAPHGLFACRQENACVIQQWVCNGKNDCLDGSDETPEACASVNKTSHQYVSRTAAECSSGFRCAGGQCVEWAAVCDDTHDCLDGSDEGGNCSTPCTPHTCPGICRRSPSGPACSCPRGLRLAADGRGCDDTDECRADVCAHRCLNTHGSFICSCYPGYALRSDRRSCKAVRGNMSVLYVSGNSVKSIYADYKVTLEYNDPNIARISDLDYNVRKNQLYVASAETGKLIEVNRTQDDLGINVITNVGRPTRVAVDWVTDNVYFADSWPGRSCIRVCNVKRKRCAKLQKLPSEAVVSALVVDPASRKMFYCVNRELESIVRSASLSGRQVADLATITNCTGLEVDSFKQRLYVAETGPSRILQMDFEGNTLKTIFTNDPNLQAPHGLVIFEDSIYFIGANSFKLSRCHLHEPRVCEPYLYSVFDANTFVIRHESVQRDDVMNDCDSFTCANVCVLGETEPQCVCDDGGISSDGSCPRVLRNELALFNGWSQQDASRAHSVSLTLVGVVLALLLLYLAVFAYYQRARRRAAHAEYVQFRYHNNPEGMTQLSSSIIEVPNAGGVSHEFINPLQLVRNIWQQSFRKQSRPHRTSGLIFDVQSQQDLSDTESDLDVRENRRILRN
ncbi:vitellogenin receptor Yl [Epargyreus clarus]|uniref:vitellogenin receptor Yl n=1 Tax=Epargyreus clarus TaxID=520877 RepID=UPI003C2BFAD9